jgi:molybdenum cofactor synthesis domain-containing protein
MIPISEAIQIIERETARIEAESVDLSATVGRVLAEDILADTDLPPFDRSQMDGYALLAADTKNAPVTLEIAGESAAGKGWRHELKPGEAVRIMTGAPVPTGADSVQKLEVTKEEDTRVTVLEPAEPGKFIVYKGAEIKKGQTVISSGEVITENMIAVLAAFGYANVEAARKPKVAILSTGSEIVDIHQTPGTDQIRNSNSAMLRAFTEKCGAATTTLPIAGDNIEDLKKQIHEAIETSDMLVMTGGVSVGKYDFTKAALLELGAEIFFEKVCLKPGKPTVFARLNDKLIFGLPGNPVSVAATFHLFVRRALLLMQGARACGLKEGFAVASAKIKGAKERDSYLPASLSTNKKAKLTTEPLRWHGSSDFVGFARAEALIFVPAGEAFEAGDVAEILFLP